MTQVLVPCSIHVQFSILCSQTQSSEHVCHDPAALQAFANETGVIFRSQSDFTHCLKYFYLFCRADSSTCQPFPQQHILLFVLLSQNKHKSAHLTNFTPPSVPPQSFCHPLLQTGQGTTCLQAPFLTHQAHFPFRPWSRGRGHLVKTQSMNHFLMTTLYLHGGWEDYASHTLKL